MRDEASDDDLHAMWCRAILRMTESHGLAALSRELAMHSELVDASRHIALIRTDVAVLTMPHVCLGLQTALREIFPEIRLIVETGNTRATPAGVFNAAARQARRAMVRAGRE